MDSTSAANLVEKIAFLERHVGAQTSYTNLDPPPLNQGDTLQIQAAARRIGDFLRLKDLTFVVGFVKQKGGVAGNVELEFGQEEVFIEISSEARESPAAVFTVLSHEICHKYLQRYSLSYTSHQEATKEDEILTDVAAVFLGLGKLMLNGCETQSRREESLPDGTLRITTTSYRFGYLGPDELAFAYRFVCAMRRIPEAEMRRGLSSDALSKVRGCERQFPEWFDTRYYSQGALPKMLASIESAVRDIQVEMAAIDRCLLYLQRGGVEPVEAWSQRTHKILIEARRSASEAETTAEYDPCLEYVRSARFSQMVSSLVALNGEAASSHQRLRRIEKIVASLGEPFVPPSTRMFTETVCKNCKTKIRLPEMARNITVVCPRCRYKFVAVTSLWSQPDTGGAHGLSSLFSSLARKLGRRP